MAGASKILRAAFQIFLVIFTIPLAARHRTRHRFLLLHIPLQVQASICSQQKFQTEKTEVPDFWRQAMGEANSLAVYRIRPDGVLDWWQR
jgi:hypothetical protein